jgi:hypothetical protein
VSQPDRLKAKKGDKEEKEERKEQYLFQMDSVVIKSIAENNLAPDCAINLLKRLKKEHEEIMSGHMGFVAPNAFAKKHFLNEYFQEIARQVVVIDFVASLTKLRDTGADHHSQ